MNLHDVEELAWRALGKKSEEIDDAMASETIDEQLHERYGIDLEMFSTIVEDLLPFTVVIISALSRDSFHAFVDVKEGRTIVKLKAN